MHILTRLGLASAALLILSGCAGRDPAQLEANAERQQRTLEERRGGITGSIMDLFDTPDESRQMAVNRYLWEASLDILSIFPIESADPFSGLITTSWGQPSGSRQAYRATVLINSPVLEADSLKVAVFRRSGGNAVPVDDETARQIEDAILTRARQLLRGAEQRG